MNPNLEKLQKLFALLKEETISPTQLKEMVAVMVAVVKKSRDENQKVSEDLKVTLNETLKYISKEHEKTLKNAEGLNELKIKRLEKMVSDTLKTAQDALREVKSIEVMDGADADEEKIIETVLKKLPKQDERKNIVEKINKGGDEKINASEIKGLPEFTREVVREVGSVGHIETPLKAGTNITITTDGTGAKVINSTATGGTVGPGTINELAYFDTTTSIASLAVATYPSLTELSYVKGLTSAVQTQLNGKANSATTLAGYGISDTKANFDTALSDGNFMYSGDAPTAHAASHAVGGADAVFPADPGADKYLKFNNTSNLIEWADVAGGGDMILASVQSVTGLKTFDTTKLAVKGSSTGSTAIASANAGATDYTATLQAATGTIAYTSDIVSQVEDSIVDGHTTIAPSGNAVFDALALKAPLTAPTFATSITGSYLTASEMLITDGSKNIVSAPVATYPSLTELSYVKGLSSAIQTQLGGKQATITFGTGVETALGVNIGSAGAPVLFNGALGTPSSGTGTNITGIPAANILAGTFGTGAYVMDTSLTVPLINGSSAANGDITINGTSNATKTTSYVLLQETGGYVGIGMNGTAPTYNLDVRGTATTDGIRSAMGYDIYSVPPPTTISGVVSAGGAVDDGTHYYYVTFTTAAGETNSKISSVVTTTTGNNTVTLTIPVSTDPRVTGRKLYRTKAGTSSFTEYLLATVANNTDVSYVDTASDASLTGSSGIAFARMNTTTSYISVRGTRSMVLDEQLTAFGIAAGFSITTGGNNAFFGYRSGYSTTTAAGNSAFGHNALENNISGATNSAFGYQALRLTTSGGNNTAMGYLALYGNLTGSYTTAIGREAGRYIADGSTARTTGTYGLYLGYNSKASADGTSNEIAIGYLAVGAGSNTIQLGGTAVTNVYLGTPTTTALGVGTIELGHATDTTITRVSAGVIAVEGVNVLTTAGGTMTGNIQLGENTSIDLDPAGSADGKYSGTCITGTAGATLAFGDLIYLDPTDSRWELADANAASGADGDSRGILGICVLAAAGDGSATKILLFGIVRADTAFPAMTINAPMYVSETAGDITGTIPTTTDAVQRSVGTAITADELYFFPSPHYQTAV